MNRKPKITVIGSYNTDLVVRTPRMPSAGETILGGPFHSGPGGKGANQAVAAARLGAEVTMVAKLGQDPYGDLAAANLEKEGVDTRFVIRTADAHTGVALIVVDSGGENMIVVAGGANDMLSAEEVEDAREAIAGADMIVVQLEIPLDSVRRAVEIARQANVLVLLNPAPGQELDAALLSQVDYLTPNETEAALITGRPISGVEQAEAAGKLLLELGVQTVIVTLGSLGAVAVTPSGVLRAPSMPVAVVDTTGAGDAFNGALAVALAEGKDLDQALAFANASGALQVTRLGTAPAMPYRADVEAFLAS